MKRTCLAFLVVFSLGIGASFAAEPGGQPEYPDINPCGPCDCRGPRPCS